MELSHVALALSILSVVILVRNSLKLAEARIALNDAARRWHKENKPTLNYTVERELRKLLDEELAKHVTPELLKQVAEDTVKKFHNETVDTLIETCTNQLRTEVVQKVKETKTVEILAHLDTKAIANALTLVSANEIMQRLPRGRDY